MKVGIIGSGYVGLVTGACLAEIGHQVLVLDADQDKIKVLKAGKIPFFEPGLEDLVKKNTAAGRLAFTLSLEELVADSLIIFVAVGTPAREDGHADLAHVEKVARQIAGCLKEYRVVVEKSTVPVETGAWIKKTIGLYNKNQVPCDVASNPEFLREGSALKDFLQPDRIVIGVESQRAEELLKELYAPIKAPLLVTDIKSAEIIKHASNSFLAVKISYINAISRICEQVGADVVKVAQGMGYDKRIGRSFLEAGAGYGGSCFPKDVAAFVKISEKIGYDFALLKEVQEINRQQKQLIVRKIKEACWVLNDKVVAVWGLAFKPDTDDMREAPAIDIIAALKAEGAKIKAYDPQGMDNAKKIMTGIDFCANPYDAVKDADVLVVLTEWEEFIKADLARVKKLMRVPILIDGRNVYDPEEAARLGFTYKGVGR